MGHTGGRMGTSWIKVVAPADLKSSALYFIGKPFGRKPDGKPSGYQLYSKLKSGKLQWSVKPGIAIRVTADGAREVIEKNPTHSLVLIEVPADAERRWRRRR